MKKTLLLIGTVWAYAILCFYIVFIKRTFNSLSLSNILMDHGDQGITEFSFLAYNYVDNYTWIIVFFTYHYFVFNTCPYFQELEL